MDQIYPCSIFEPKMPYASSLFHTIYVRGVRGQLMGWSCTAANYSRIYFLLHLRVMVLNRTYRITAPAGYSLSVPGTWGEVVQYLDVCRYSVHLKFPPMRW